MQNVTVAAKTIKTISLPNYHVGLYELSDGKFIVVSSHYDEVRESEPLSDFNWASVLFQTRLMELEGH